MHALVIAAVVAVATAAPQGFQYPTGKTAYTKQQAVQYEEQKQSVVEQKPFVNQYVQQTKPVHPPIAITSFERIVEPAGDYRFSYGTEHGINLQEQANIKEIRDEKNEPHHVPAVKGSYSFVGDDGQTYTVDYVADEFGFRASGAHLPQAPAIPADIKKAIDTLPPLPRDEPEQKVVVVQQQQQQQQQQQPAYVQQYQQQQYQQRYQQYKQF